MELINSISELDKYLPEKEFGLIVTRSDEPDKVRIIKLKVRFKVERDQ